MGCDPAILTGSVGIEERRALFERVWGARLPRDRGLNLMGMIDAAAAGRLKALWVIGYDILDTLANAHSTREALRQLEFVMVQDLFITRTASAVGHLFLPAASNFEKDGTFMNAERRIQRVRKAVEPRGAARPDWWIISALAARMGHGAAFSYGSPQDIWNEIRQVWPEAAGATYGRLEHGGLQWPCRTEEDPGTPILHVSNFSKPGRALLQRIDYIASPERTSDEFPLLLSTGRNLFQFNAGTMTMRTRNIRLRPTDTLDLSPADADRSAITEGARVRVRSRYGSVLMQARITDALRPGTVFATFHDVRVGLNKLTGPFRDRIVQAPEYKVTAVAVERA
jgi:formate dehydrogenase major subunit